MKAMLMTAPGGADVLQPGEVPTPRPGPCELLVRLRAAGVNPLDTKIRKLHNYYPQNLPVVLGCDGAGVVEAVGDGVRRFAQGDEVYFFDGGIGGLGAASGTYAEYKVVNEHHVAKKPAKLSMAEAAAAPLVLITAWEALVDRVAVKPGETVLVHAGAGGVGHIAVQLAKHLGARVAATASAAKHAFVRDLGADHMIDYRTADFAKETLAWTGGIGADVVFDTLGGPTFAQSFPAVRVCGRIATLIATPCDQAQLNLARLRNLVIGYEQMTMPPFLGIEELRRRQTRILEEGARLIDAGTLKIVVGREVPLAAAAEAHRFIEDGHATGKVVLRID